MLRNLYDRDMYRFDDLPRSYWETTVDRPVVERLDGDLTTDVAIIGGGYFGLSAALHLARDFQIDVAVLDAGEPAWGASSRNGGFNCIPATKLSVPRMVQRHGEAATRAFYRAQVEGQDLVTDLIASEGFEVGRQGDGIYQLAHSPAAARSLAGEAEHLRRIGGIRCEVLSAGEFAETGHAGGEAFGALRSWPGYGLNPLKFAVGLAESARRRGARLYGHSAVTGWDRDGAVHVLRTARGTVRARRVVVALNGYLPDGLHPALDARVMPAISSIVVTRPLSAAELSAHRFETETPIFNTRHMLFYYRKLPDGRILFGGRGDVTGRKGDGDRVSAWLTERLRDLFPAWRDVAIEHAWNGCVSITRKLLPSVGALDDDPTVWFGFGCHGNGVNTAPWMGRAVARGIGGGAFDAPEIFRPLPARLPPFGWLRRFGLRLAYARYALGDALS